MKTKKELEAEGWLFTTTNGGAKAATNVRLNCRFYASSVQTLRKQIANEFERYVRK
jgi:hypothetical protein